MGTSLHPDKSPPDDLLKTAIVLSGKGQFDRPLKRVSQTPNEPPKRAVLSPRIPCEPKSLASILTVIVIHVLLWCSLQKDIFVPNLDTFWIGNSASFRNFT